MNETAKQSRAGAWPGHPSGRIKPEARRSVYRQILLACLLPLGLMGTLLATYTTLNTAQSIEGQLRASGYSVAGVTAEAVYDDLERSANPVKRADLIATATFNLHAIQGGAFVVIAAPDGIVAVAARPGLGSKPVQDALRENPDRESLSVGPERFLVARREVLKYDGNGSLGTVYVGLETRSVAEQVERALVPTLALLLASLGLATLLATWFAARVTRPILHATRAANQISLGNLETLLDAQSNDEIGDLMQALERLRFSLKFMLERNQRSR